MNFGGVSPPSPGDGQYLLRVFDRDRQITNPLHDLDPFRHVAPIDYDLNDFLQHATQNSNKQFILVIIIRNLTPPQIEQMIQNNLRILPNLYMLHLFFTNGSRFQNAWRIQYAPLVQSCRSITANLSRDLRAICAAFCDLNIEFCEDRAQEYERQNERSIANDFRTQKLKYIDLTYSYKLQQLNEVSQI